MRNIRIQLAYDGSSFFGWQRQDGFETIQESLEGAIEDLTGECVTIHGSGRTDTGVHALRQVANFHLSTSLSDDRLRHALNAHLPEGIVVRRLETCRDDFHARFSATGKRYVYVTATTRFRPPFASEYVNWSSRVLDFPAMEEAGRALIGKHDFCGMCSVGSEPKTTVRHIRSLRWIRRRERVAFVIEANGFLYNMVRTIAGTLLDIGRGRLPVDRVEEVLASGNRSDCGPTAPAAGLYLLRVLYDEETFVGADRGPQGSPGVFQL
jgi:tRNA pseudouridine38-40 synthase